MNNRNNYLICHITDSHHAMDERIFYKAAKYTIATGYQVCIFGIHPREEKIDGIRIIPISYSGGKLGKGFLGLISLRHQVLKTDADIFHFHDPGLLLLGLSLSLCGKRVIYDVHEDYEQKLLTRLKLPFILRKFISKIWWYFEAIASKHMDYLVMADTNIFKKFNRKNAIVIPNVPGREFWSNCNFVRTFDERARLIYIGTITRDRGLLETIEALQYTHNDVSFHIYGPCNDENLIGHYRNNSKVFWHGFIEWTELSRELAKADIGTILLQPVPAYLYYPGENIVKLWEYMSMGLPVIISNFPKLEKLCKEIEFGVAVDPTDPKKIAKVIDDLIDHPEKRATYSKNGMRYVREEFNADIIMPKLIEVYDQLLDRK